MAEKVTKEMNIMEIAGICFLQSSHIYTCFLQRRKADGK